MELACPICLSSDDASLLSTNHKDKISAASTAIWNSHCLPCSHLESRSKSLMDVFQDCLVKPRTDEQYLSKTVNDRTRIIAFITASRIIIPASGVWCERFCFLTCDTTGAQIKVPVRGISRISRESRVIYLRTQSSFTGRVKGTWVLWLASSSVPNNHGKLCF